MLAFIYFCAFLCFYKASKDYHVSVVLSIHYDVSFNKNQEYITMESGNKLKKKIYSKWNYLYMHISSTVKVL